MPDVDEQICAYENALVNIVSVREVDPNVPGLEDVRVYIVGRLKELREEKERRGPAELIEDQVVRAAQTGFGFRNLLEKLIAETRELRAFKLSVHHEWARLDQVINDHAKRILELEATIKTYQVELAKADVQNALQKERVIDDLKAKNRSLEALVSGLNEQMEDILNPERAKWPLDSQGRFPGRGPKDVAPVPPLPAALGNFDPAAWRELNKPEPAQFTHGCDQCIYLGRFRLPEWTIGYDLYFCPLQGGELVYRYGNDCFEYEAALLSENGDISGRTAIQEAYRRAVARGLIKVSMNGG